MVIHPLGKKESKPGIKIIVNNPLKQNNSFFILINIRNKTNNIAFSITYYLINNTLTSNCQLIKYQNRINTKVFPTLLCTGIYL